MALISVIIPVYNSEKYLKECLESIMNQTFKDIEIIIINDGSIDSSLEICKQLADLDDRISVYTIKNGGVSNARNLGMTYCNSEYIHFVDSDDYLESTILEELYNSISKNNCDLSMCGYFKEELLLGEKGRKVKFNCKDFVGTVEQFLGNIMYYYYPPIIQGPCWKLFRKSIIVENNIRFNISMNFGEDLEFVLNYLKKCSNISCIDKCLYTYRVHGNTSLSTKFNEHKLDIYILLAKKLQRLEKIKLNYRTDHMEIIITNCFINYLTELLSFTGNLELKKVLDIVKSSLERVEIRNSFQYLKQKNIKYFLYYLLINSNSSSMLIFAFLIKEKLRFFAKGAK